MPFCFLKNPLPWMYVLGLILVSNFFGYGFSSIIILTSILILSNLLFTTFSKQTPPPLPPLPENSTLQSTKPALVLTEPETEHVDQTKEEQEQQEEDGQSKMSRSAQFPPQVSIGDGQGLTLGMRESWSAAREMPLRQNYDPVTKIIDDKSFPSLIMLSESVRSSTSEDSEEAELYWPYNDQGDIFRSRENSDGSISDEDSLIEISLPSGVYIDHHYKEEEEKDKKKLGFYKEHKVCLAELILAELNEMNEEDNLIEIDLSIGSIKCPRFEIQA